MKTYSLIKTKTGERKGTEISVFYGDNNADRKMLNEVENYLRSWLKSYNNSLTIEDTDELLNDFDGSFIYDVWIFNLEENENK